MKNQEDIHFRTGGNITHAGIEVLPSGKDIEYIVIERIEFKEHERINGRDQEGVWLAHFAKNPYTNLPLVLNSTNRKRIAKLFPECDDYIARLKNIAVRLTKEKTRDPQDGGDCWGLRISTIPAKEPKPAEKKVLTADKIEKAVEWAKSNGKTIEDIEKIYTVSDDIKAEIVKKLSNA